VIDLVDLEPVVFRGELVALAGPERFHIVAPWLQERPDGDPDLRFVVFMCLFRRQIELGELPGPFTSERAELWARCALIEADELLARWDISDDALVVEFGAPADQIAIARRELRP
jgi:hypothetical protein